MTALLASRKHKCHRSLASAAIIRQGRCQRRRAEPANKDAARRRRASSAWHLLGLGARPAPAHIITYILFTAPADVLDFISFPRILMSQLSFYEKCRCNEMPHGDVFA